jgi:hypothetical protein
MEPFFQEPSLPRPGEFLPGHTEGTTRIDDLHKSKVACQSRNYRRRPIPRCGYGSYRDRLTRGTLHNLGNPLIERRPRRSSDVIATSLAPLSQVTRILDKSHAHHIQLSSWT